MKGDFTRFTFEPRKRYTSVLMQQGRLQLDSDWNEQMSIQTYLQQRQAQDMIGKAAGTPATESGFQILPTPNGEDLVIRFGRFYINGILCDFPVTSTFKAIPLAPTQSAPTQSAPTQARLLFTAMDGQRFQVGEWLELQPEGILFKITIVDQEQRLLTFDRPLPSKPLLEFRRITTYQTQIDYPASAPTSGKYLVYLDVWQRHITAIDDPDLREVALNVPDTATRIQTLWQAKLLPIAEAPADNTMETVEQLQEWQELTRERQVELIVSTDLQPDKPGISNNQGNYLGVENRLYRVEIHNRGLLGQATFKWSRDNGSTVSAIASIDGNAIKLKNTIQEAYKLFKQSPEDQPWVEILTEDQELNNQPGVLVQIIATKPPNQLIFETSQIRGGTLPKSTGPKSTGSKSTGQSLKVRRWDHTQDAVLMTSEQWLFLEDGIKIKFQTLAQEFYETGDYWLIPARSIDRSIKWKQDDQGVFLPQPPAGIQHNYGFLAAVHYDDEGQFSPLLAESWEKSDLRIQFLPLIHRLQLGDAALGVGIKPPWAKFHVKGAEVRSIRDAHLTTSPDSPSELIVISPKDEFRLHPGYTLIAMGESRLVTSVSPTDRTRIGINVPFSNPLLNEPFDYHEPVIRLTTHLSNPDIPEFFMSPAGRIGLGTQQPMAQLHLKQSPSLTGPIARFETETQLGLLIDEQGNVGIGIEPMEARLQVKGALKLGDRNQSVGINRELQQVKFTTAPSCRYVFDQGITVDAGTLMVSGGTIGAGPNASLILQTAGRDRLILSPNDSISLGKLGQPSTLNVVGKAGIGSDLVSTDIPNNGLLVQGNLLARSLVTIGTDTAPATLQVKGDAELSKAGIGRNLVPTDIPDNGLLVQGNLLARSLVTIGTDTTPATLQVKGNAELENAKLHQAGIGTNVVVTDIPDNGLLVQGNLLARSLVTIGTDASPAKLQVKGSAELGPTSNPLNIVVNNNKTEFSGTKGYQFSDRLSVTQGGSAVAGGLDLTSGNLSIATGSIRFGTTTSTTTTPHEIQSSVTTGISLLTAATPRVTISPTGTVTVSTPAPNQFFGVSGQAIVGQNFVANRSTVTNGLLVEGHVGIGNARPLAKLDVASTTSPEDFGLRITTAGSKQSLLSVQNRGIVGIGVADNTAIALDSTLNVHGKAAIGKSVIANNEEIPADGLYVQGDIQTKGRLMIAPDFHDIPENLNLYVSGNVLVHGEVQTDDVTTRSLSQSSSRSLKTHIDALTSQESTQILQDLKPVKFVYRDDAEQLLHFGFIAEEVPEVLATSDRKAIHPLDIVTLLTKTVQDQQIVITDLNRTVQNQQKAIERLIDRINVLENRQ